MIGIIVVVAIMVLLAAIVFEEHKDDRTKSMSWTPSWWQEREYYEKNRRGHAQNQNREIDYEIARATADGTRSEEDLRSYLASLEALRVKI
jgi:hypothetical protein